MFEKLVAELLTRYLGQYIKTLNTENLKIGIWSGDVSLENLELKKRALEKFNLPFTIKEGFLGKLSIKIPWNNLKMEPVIIVIDKLYITATPKSSTLWDEEDEEILYQKKLKKLKVYEALKKEEKEKREKNIVANLQILIYNVHVRFEDTVTNPSSPYCFGITLEELLAESTNEDWKSSFIHTPHNLVHKLITLKNLSVYWDTHTIKEPTLSYNNIIDFKTQMTQLIFSKSRPPPLHTYLLNPVCGSLKLLINKSIIPNKNIPAYTFNFDFDEISWFLESNQYSGIMALVDWFTILKRGEKYRKFKPKSGLINSKLRWEFAINCILSEIKEKRAKWNPSFFEKRRKDRLDYINLYKLKQKKKTLNDTNKQKLERSLAEAQLKGEESILKAPTSIVSPQSLSPKSAPLSPVSTSRNINNTSSGGGGWFGWLGWGNSQSKSKMEEKREEEMLLHNLELTEEQKRELYATIDYDEHQTTKNIVYPKDYVKTRINFNMKKGSISFRLKPYDVSKLDSSKNADLVIQLNNMSLKLDKFVESLYAQTILESICVRDYFTENTVYPVLMRPLIKSLLGQEYRQESTEDDIGGEEVISSPNLKTSTGSSIEEKQPLFEMIFQQNPLNSDANYSIFIETLPLEIIYNKSLMDSVFRFFGNAPSDTLKDIEESARNQIKYFKDKTTLRIQYELQTHKTVDLDININAPHLIIPESFIIKSSPILILDLGSFSMISVNKWDEEGDENSEDLHKQEVEEEIEEDLFKKPKNLPFETGSNSSSNPQFNEEDDDIPKYLYDLYQLQLKNIQFFIKSQGESLQLVNKFDINFKIYKCIIKSQTLLSKLKLFGNLPSLNILLSQPTIEMLIRIANTITPKDHPELNLTTSKNDIKKANIDEVEEDNVENLENNDQQEEKNNNSKQKYQNYSQQQFNEGVTLIDSTELEINPLEQVPILMIYNTIFEVTFSVPTVSLVIIENDKPFIKLFLSDIGAQVYKRTFDISILLSLKKLYIEDLFQQFNDPSFKYLATSSPDDILHASLSPTSPPSSSSPPSPQHSSTSSNEDNSSSNLISISISVIQKNSPQYNGVSQQIDISFNTLHINLNKKLVIKIINLVKAIESTIIEIVKSSRSAHPSTTTSATTTNTGVGRIGGLSMEVDNNNPKIIISTTMKSLIIHLNEDDESYFAFSINNLSLNFDIDIESSLMRFKLGNLLITDISKESSKDLGPLFGTNGEHIVEVYVMSNKNSTQLYDTKIGVRMSSVKLVVIRGLIDRLTEYFEDFDIDNKMDQILSDSTKSAVEMIEVLFEIDVNAPRIIFPKNVVSPYVIIADLGHISVFNYYSKQNVTNAESEEIYIYASSINFHSCKFQNGQVLDQTIEQLSNKVNLYVCIETFISDPLYPDLDPKQKVLGEISPIAIKITDQQYSLLISIIKTLVEPNMKKKKRKIKTFQKLERQNRLTAESAIPKEIKDQVSFKLPHISLEIFRKNKESVVFFEIDELEVSLIDYVNGNEYTTISLNSIDLSDTRKSSTNKFKKLLYHSESHSKYKEVILYICENRNGNIEMKLNIDHFRGIVVPESLIAMIDFILPGVMALSSLSDVSPVVSPVLDPVKYPVVQSNNLKDSNGSNKNLFLSSTSLGPQKTIIIEATNTEIWLVDDPTRLDSKVLIMKGSTLGKVLIQTGDPLTYTDIQFCVDKLELYKCRIDNPDQTAVSIIDPLSLTFTLTKVEGKDSLPLDILISVDPVHISFSYQDFLLCMSVYKNIMVLADKFQSLNTNNIKVSGGGLKLKPIDSTPNPRINFQSPGISFTLINDHNGKYSGLADVKISNICVEVIQKKTLIGLFLSANYFNNSKSVWEPLLEEWGCKFAIEDLGNESLNIVVSTSQKLNLNITKSLFDLVHSSYQTFKSMGVDKEEIMEKSSKLAKIQLYKTPNSRPLILRNNTGLEIGYSISTKNQVGKEYTKLANGQEVFLDLPNSSKFRDATSISMYRISVLIQGWIPITNLPIDRSGIYICNLIESQQSPTNRPLEFHTRLAYEITACDSSKLLILRSNILLVNETGHLLEYIDQPISKNFHGYNRIEPGQSQSLPIVNNSQSNIVLSFRSPSGSSNLSGGGRWSQPIYCNNLVPGYLLLECSNRYYCVQIDTHYQNKNPDSSLSNSLEDSSDADDEPKSNHIIKIVAPLVIENMLACSIELSFFTEDNKPLLADNCIKMTSGEKSDIYSINTENAIVMIKMKIPNFGRSNSFQINRASRNDINNQTIKLQDRNGASLLINVHQRPSTPGSITLTLYCKYWITNNTGLNCLFKVPNSTLAAGQKEIETESVDVYRDPRNWYTLPSTSPPPLMFSPPNFDYTNTIITKIDNSQWSNIIKVDSRQEEDINVQKEQYSRELNLQFTSIINTLPQYYKTKHITIVPKYVLINNLPFRIYYQQTDSSIFKNYYVEPSESLPFHFLERTLAKKISIKLSPEHHWSGSFTVSKSTSFHLRLQLPNTGDSKKDRYKDSNTYLPLVQIISDKGTLFIVFNSESKDCPPYRIENLTKYSLILNQNETKENIILTKNNSTRYVWDKPQGVERLNVSIQNSNFKKSINLNLLQVHAPLQLKIDDQPTNDSIQLEVYARGPTNVLRLTDQNSVIIQRDNSPDRNSSDGVVGKSIQFSGYFGGISLSLVDGQPKELLYATLRGLTFSFNQLDHEQHIHFSIKSLKVDNQLYNTQYPVMIVTNPSSILGVSSTATNTENNVKDAIKVVFKRSTKYKYDEKIGIDYVKELKIDAQPIEAQIDEALIFHIYNMIQEIQKMMLPSTKKLENLDATLHSSKSFIPIPENLNSQRIYFEQLYLPSVDMIFSYSSSNFSGAMIGAIANIDKAPLHLDSWRLEHQFISTDGLLISLLSHYKWEFSKVLLYSDIIGGPLSLASNLTRGINDFIYESTSGLNSTEEFTRGVAKGTKSLVKNSLYGIFNSASKITGSIGKAIAPLSMDDTYLNQREKNSRLQPKNSLDGVSSGLHGLSKGLAHGISGLINQPLKEYQSQGAPGLVVGIFKGILGSFVKPTVGAIDMISQTSKGIKNSYLDPSALKSRTRPPRFIGPDGILKSYNFEKSTWQEILKSLGTSRQVSNEWYVTHYSISVNGSLHYILLSTKYFILLNQSLDLLFSINLWCK
eukprot:gene4812-5998_t